jgi:hypothetical protein
MRVKGEHWRGIRKELDGLWGEELMEAGRKGGNCTRKDMKKVFFFDNLFEGESSSSTAACCSSLKVFLVLRRLEDERGNPNHDLLILPSLLPFQTNDEQAD